MKHRKESNEFSFDLIEVAEGWQKAIMGEIADVVGGGTPDTSDETNFSDEGFPWLTPADLSNFKGIYIRRGKRCLSEKGLRSSSAVMIPKGTVLMSSRAPIGYLAIAANSISTNQGFKSFVCHEAVSPEFVYYWLRYLSPYLESFGSGTTFLEISGSKAKEIPVLLAPLSEQKRIAAKVEELLAHVKSVLAAACSGRITADWREKNPDVEPASELLSRILIERRGYWKAEKYVKKQLNGRRQNDEYKEQTLPEMSESFELPERWIWATIGRLYEVKYGLSEPLRKLAPDCDLDLPVISMANITGHGFLDLSKLKYFPLSLSKRQNLLLRRGDLLFNWRNAPKWIGKTAVFDLIGDYINASFLLRLRPPCPKDDGRFIWLYLNLLRLNGFFNFASRAAVNQSNFNATEISKISVPLPPLAEQQEIVRRVEALFKLADSIEKRVEAVTEQAEKLTQAILSKAFRGELVPTEAELARREGRSYESASELLARIKSDGESKGGSKSVNRIRRSQRRLK
jgi:type I restriction enzyme S subunit